MTDLTNRRAYLGAQNDAWFIIHGEPPAQSNDNPRHDADRVAIARVLDEPACRRLAACWNACEGISTENLQQNLPVKELAERYNATLRERDELQTHLDAIKAAAKQMSGTSKAHCGQLLQAIHQHPTQQPASRITSTSVCGTNEEKCNWVETEPYGSRCTTCGITIPF